VNRLLQERRYFFAFFRRAKASAKRGRTRRAHGSHGSHMVGCVPRRISGRRWVITISICSLFSGSAGKQTRFVSKTIKNDSFFNFFAPPEGQWQ